MNFLVFTALFIIPSICNAFPSSTWEAFKVKYGKSYATSQEESIRKAIWEKSLSYIEKHNAEAAEGKHTYTLGENKYADLAPQEFRLLMNGYHRRSGVHNTVHSKEVLTDNLPSTVDWRDEGIVTDVKDQGQCGSCWAFSTTGSIEGQWALSSSDLVSLSEQNLVDCADSTYGNEGCDGGEVDYAFKYVIANKGIDTESSYPYKATQGTCSYSSSNKGASISSYVDVTKRSESDLQAAVANVGPVSIAIDASHWSFQLYSSGIYDPTFCSSTFLDHAVLAVGYGTSDGKDYWLVKNSWGTSWGIEGYIMMIRNSNNKCGVATQASYPVV